MHDGQTNPATAADDKRELVTIFVCVKLRGKKRSSCACSGSRDLLTQLKASLSPGDSAHVIVRPSRCLKKCKKGPAVVLFATADQPPNKAPKKAWKRADARFKRVQADDVMEIIRSSKSLVDKIRRNRKKNASG